MNRSDLHAAIVRHPEYKRLRELECVDEWIELKSSDLAKIIEFSENLKKAKGKIEKSKIQKTLDEYFKLHQQKSLKLREKKKANREEAAKLLFNLMEKWGNPLPSKDIKGCTTITSYTMPMEKAAVQVLKQQPSEVFYVDLRINLSAPKKEIMENIACLYEEYQKGAQQVRDKEFLESPWDIWDLKNSGKSFAEIARDLSGESGAILTNPALKAAYDRVRRSYKKACEMISSLDKLK
jgi:hypothetical protein